MLILVTPKLVLTTHGNMSQLCQDRSSRWHDIQKGLQFIQSTLPYPGTQEEYEVFIHALVRNLFGEGNDVFCEGEWARSVELHTEALNITEYAESEDIVISPGAREKMFANRAAAYLNIGLYDQALEDCEKALTLNDGNYRALYRKARCLKEIGRHTEAYDAVAKCSLAVPQDSKVIQLTHELAQILGLKIRKAYIRSKPALNIIPGSTISSATNDKFSNGSPSVDDIEMDVSQVSMETAGPVPVPSQLSVEMPTSIPSTVPVLNTPPEGLPAFERSEPEPAPLNVLPPTSSISPMPPMAPEPLNHESGPLANHMLVNGNRSHEVYNMPEAHLDFNSKIIGDDLDDLLDNVAHEQSTEGIPTMDGPLPLPTRMTSVGPLFMPPHIIHPFLAPLTPLTQQCTVTLPAPYHKPNAYSIGLDPFPSALDSLDCLSLSDAQTDDAKITPHSLFNFASPAVSPGYAQHPIMPMNNNNQPLFPPIGVPLSAPESNISRVDLSKNPLADTHEFKQACAACYVKSGPRVLDYTHYVEEHKCKKDILLGRIKYSGNIAWKLIRPRPTKTQYVGPYYICKDVAMGEECRYPGHCTFAYCQEEIDVWTLERKGFISRELLCDPFGSIRTVHLTVPTILQEHHGIFMFLCEVCFDHKPRIISKTNTENPSLCSHPVTKHNFEEKKCLVHILKENTVRYSKIRPLAQPCQMDLCRHEVRYGCQREDFCFYAHSLVELKVWMLQSQQGISHEGIVQDAHRYWSMEANSQGIQEIPAALKRFGPSNLKMQFVCVQCWRNGQVSEPDKNRKYCGAKARHPWAKDRRVQVIVSSNERKKWTPIRPLPTKKPVPSQFEICMHVSAGKKCQYIGNCTFAHSAEERDLWTYMKENSIADLEQLYELWLQSQRQGWNEESSNCALRENGKQIHMPTDYAEEVAGNHCWLCGKNCNSEKQWQQHITSDKHKERVFNSEDDQNCWQYRFPTGTFKVCERFLKGTCTEEELCKFAHGDEELKEWRDRREFLMMKLAKARKDHLIAPNDNDFGKYSFLLKDIN
ncbi:zinc finger CCCH domain-containing protein 7A isoform X2 [Clupea harengus]|uniref:Zinc finger CCCH domain-containing protein 7A isoform X2 n=1 Tax=Clupea harengus TaxID=7950 RepID=A0A8M1KBX2_CLUHA|nr:zinc finger CCCH domain-containing protein 7A isoform X2 [Clupea harengus]